MILFSPSQAKSGQFNHALPKPTETRILKWFGYILLFLHGLTD